MLVMKVLAKFSEAHRGKSLLIERRVVAAAQIPVQPEHQHRVHAHIFVISTAHIGDIARQLPRPGVVLPAQPANPPDFLLRRRGGQSLGKHAHHRMILLRALVAADNVIIQHRLEIPALILRHLREVVAAVQALALRPPR